MNCNSRGKGDGPYETQIFVCRNENKSIEYFIVSDGHNSIQSGGFICSDENVTISYYKETEI